MRTDLVCIVCFGTNDREITRFTTLRLKPKVDPELGDTLLRRILGEQVQKRRAGRMAAPKGKSDVSAPTAFGPEPKIQMGQQEIN